MDALVAAGEGDGGGGGGGRGVFSLYFIDLTGGAAGQARPFLSSGESVAN